MNSKVGFISILFLFQLISLGGICQLNPNEYVEPKPVLMKNETTFGFNFHSSGTIGFQFRRSYNLTVDKKWIFETDIVGIKHPKEIKTVNRYFDNAKSYVYGKENTFNSLRLGTGIQKIVYSKFEKNGIEIRFVYSGGLSLGILKPVYLNILTDNGPNGEKGIVVEKYNPEKHFTDNIYGRAPFTEGLDEIGFRPGAYGRIGFNFEYAPIFEDVKSIEVGAIIDAFPKEIPIMALIDNKQLFLTFYITVMYGRKW